MVAQDQAPSRQEGWSAVSEGARGASILQAQLLGPPATSTDLASQPLGAAAAQSGAGRWHRRPTRTHKGTRKSTRKPAGRTTPCIRSAMGMRLRRPGTGMGQDQKEPDTEGAWAAEEPYANATPINLNTSNLENNRCTGIGIVKNTFEYKSTRNWCNRYRSVMCIHTTQHPFFSGKHGICVCPETIRIAGIGNKQNKSN
jgi:hypothetical protein